jgi:hypothetical protein
VCASRPAAASGSQVAAPSACLLLKSGMRLSSGQIHRVLEIALEAYRWG